MQGMSTVCYALTISVITLIALTIYFSPFWMIGKIYLTLIEKREEDSILVARMIIIVESVMRYLIAKVVVF
jgi:hypothetical protein